MSKIPLTWLQAFEAAGRTGSFKAAASELNVSPSNISHQVRDLESYLGTLLFSRNGRQVTLTQEGHNYLPALTQGFQSIRQASPDIKANSKRLQIGAFPFLANELLTPSIAQLKILLPQCDIRLYTHTDLAALSEVDPEKRLDLIVRYGPTDGRFPGNLAAKIGDVALVPVVGNATPHISNPEQLFDLPLIKVIGPFQGWTRWQAHFNLEQVQLEYALETDSYHSAMLAVERGEGACLAIMPFLSPWIRASRVRALDDWLTPVPEYAAFAVWAPYQQGNPQRSAFVDWLIEHLS